jgi:hypothetical protein
MEAQIRKHDWPTIRTAYVSESPRPSYAELSDRFGVPLGTLTRVSSDEGWPDLRAKRLELAVSQSDSLEVIQRAGKMDTAVSDMGKDVALAALAGLLRTMEMIEADKELKPRARVDMLNTVSFALQNTANACHRLGIIGLPEALKRAANGGPDGNGNGQWSPQMLASLNVTINGMQTEKPTRHVERAESMPTSDLEARLSSLKKPKN